MEEANSTISRKFTYADDLALLHSGNWKELERTSSQDFTSRLEG